MLALAAELCEVHSDDVDAVEGLLAVFIADGLEIR